MADLKLYEKYEHLLFERRDHGILWITINRPERFNATNNRLHWELSKVWLDIGEDPDTLVAVITGAGQAFSAGGDFELIEPGLYLDVAPENAERFAGAVVRRLGDAREG